MDQEALPPFPVSPGSTGRLMALITLYLLCLGACLIAHIEQQGLGGWHFCQSHFGILTALRGHDTLHSFPERTRKNIQSIQNKKSKPLLHLIKLF